MHNLWVSVDSLLIVWRVEKVCRLVGAVEVLDKLKVWDASGAVECNEPGDSYVGVLAI